ncbi:MAG: hypothetical protein AB7Q01_15295 [Gammaproteobacteria bacterium]
MSANMPGKVSQMINYPMGIPDYLAQWRASAQAGYAGFDIA